jgi:UDP-N-acetylmuramoylalanine--D-glutamate ligase
MGAALSGIAAAKLLVFLGARVAVSEKKPIEQLEKEKKELDNLGVKIISEAEAEKNLASFSLLVVSPGVPINHPIIATARSLGAEVIGEIELAFRFISCPILAVTGSNGKSTVTDLTGYILKKAGLDCYVGGNIGSPLADLAIEQSQGQAQNIKWAVVEISSFQLETIESFKARGAAFLNLTPDHLDRHATMESYFELKKRIFNLQGPKDLSIINLDDPLLSTISPRGRVFGFSRSKRSDFGAYLEENEIIVVENSKIVARADFKSFSLFGAHNQENVMAAVGLCYAAQIEPQRALDLACDYKSSEHRLSLVGSYGGVDFVDDSKATNVGAVARALESFDRPIILILGGRDKDLDFSYLAPYLKDRVKLIVAMGECREKVKAALESVKPVRLAVDMKQAVSIASQEAKSGEVVLLSPATASFDQFRDYKHRGEVFAREASLFYQGASPQM